MRPETRRAAGWSFRLRVALAVVLSLPAAVLAADARGEGGALAGVEAGALHLVPCRLPGLATEARCGRLLRPLRPGPAPGAQLPIEVAVLPAVARVPRADPVVFFAGGPGQGAIDLAGTVRGLLGRLNNRRDLILIDLRGTGRSAPLACGFDSPQAVWRPLQEQFDPARRGQAVAECRDRLVAGPLGDLAAYGTSRAVEDVIAVLDALGRRQVNLVGVSYGTRVALEFARQAPERVRRTVLDGVAPADMRLAVSGRVDGQAALEALLAGCQAQPACARAHPDLRSRLLALLSGPARTVRVTHPVTGVREDVALTRETLLALMRGPLYAPALAAALPAAIAAASEGRLEPLAGLAAAAAGPRAPSLATGLHLSVVCSEDLPVAAPDAAVGSAGPAAASPLALDDPYERLCAGWPRYTPPPGYATVPVARSPVWLLSGGVDPVTPPRHGERTAQALGELAVHTVVPAAGHGLLAGACIRDAAARFIDEPDAVQARAQAREAGERCARALPRPLAFEPPGQAPAAGGAR